MTFLNFEQESQIQSVARTDVVLALPDPDAKSYGWPKASLTWNNVRRDILLETIRQGWAKDLCSFLAEPQSRLLVRQSGFRDNQGVTPLNDDLGALGDPAGYQPRPTAGSC